MLSLSLTISYQGSASTTPTTQLKVIPKILIPRSCLPLAYLELESLCDQDSTTKSRFFSARIGALDVLNVPEGLPYEPKILIVQNYNGHELYAVERVQEAIYALCRLSDWLILEDIGKGLMKARKAGKIAHGASVTNPTKPGLWWKAATVVPKRMNDSEGKKAPGSGSLQLAMKPPKEIRPAKPVLNVSKPGVSTDAESYFGLHNEQIHLSNGDEVTCSIEPLVIIAMIKAQYLEALYMSKVFSRLLIWI